MAWDASSLHDQFLISRDRAIEAASWKTMEHEGWIVSHHVSLPLVPIRVGDGARIGYFLGFPIADEGRRIVDECRAPFPSVAKVTDEELEDFVFSFGGRFACLLSFGQTSRVVLDACASLALVFSPDRREAASTSTVLGSTAGLGSDRLGLPEDVFPGRKGFFPAGLTGDPQIRRLLPNHYLDLRSWAPVRHWPPPDFHADGEASIPDHVERIVTTMRASVAAVVREREAYVSLTRGMDSRMLLACSREFLDRISFFTFDWGEPSAKDVTGASYLARKLGLEHRVLVPDRSASIRDEWDVRTGFSGASGKAPFFLGAARRDLDLRRGWLIAYGGEIGRAILVGPEDRPEDPSDPADFLRRMLLPECEAFVAAMDEWLRGVEWADHILRLELALLEHQWACHASPQIYGFAPFPLVVSPFSHRAVVASMLKLPLDFRRARSVTRAVVRATWPELARLPFKDLGQPRRPIRRFLRKALRGARGASR